MAGSGCWTYRLEVCFGLTDQRTLRIEIDREYHVTDKAAYTEKYRPRFHFTARENWINDPNGCAYHDGEYHLFFQHNPSGLDWGNMTWGHAVSPDLVHWRQLPHALVPYDNGTIFSGSAVEDTANTSGLGQKHRGPLVAAFTHAREPFGQSIAYSNDRGRSWKLYDGGRHVVPNQGLDDGERDPRVFRHEPSGTWGMALWVQKGRIRFFASANLLQWTPVGDFAAEGFFECPDIFELPLDGDRGKTKWVLHDAAFNYWIGSFDGAKFTAESGPVRGDLGANYYAAQTWSNTGSRTVQIAWMRGGEYPGMPFNQQMSFPCELSLRTTDRGVRLCRVPVPEISTLYAGQTMVTDRSLGAGEELGIETGGELLDIQLEAEVGPDTAFSIGLHGQIVNHAGQQVECLGGKAPLSSVDGVVRLRLLVDRTSIELFGNDGELSMSSCFVPSRMDTTVRLRGENGAFRVRRLVVNRLRSAWE
jgi:sucrose-6-phosphate hydrolase SacC (GH32 family)